MALIVPKLFSMIISREETCTCQSRRQITVLEIKSIKFWELFLPGLTLSVNWSPSMVQTAMLSIHLYSESVAFLTTHLTLANVIALSASG